MTLRMPFAKLAGLMLLSCSAATAFAGCEDEARNAEAAGFNAERVCAAATPETASDCDFAAGVFAEALAQYRSCMRSDSSGPNAFIGIPDPHSEQ